MSARPLLVNQKKAAEMLGVSVDLFCRLEKTDHRLMPAVIPMTKEAKRYLVSDLEEYARSLKYPHSRGSEPGEMWGDDQSAA